MVYGIALVVCGYISFAVHKFVLSISVNLKINVERALAHNRKLVHIGVSMADFYVL